MGKPHLIIGLNTFLPPADQIHPDEINDSKIPILTNELEKLRTKSEELKVLYEKERNNSTKKKASKPIELWESDQAYCKVCETLCDVFCSCSRCKAYMHPQCVAMEFCMSVDSNPEFFWSSVASESLLCPQCTKGIISSKPLSHLGQVDAQRWRLLDKVSLIQRNRLASKRFQQETTAKNLIWSNDQKTKNFAEAWDKTLLIIRWAAFRYIFLETRGRLRGVVGAGNSCTHMAVLSQKSAWLTTRAVRFASKVKLLLTQYGDDVTWISTNVNNSEGSLLNCTEISLERFRKLDSYFATFHRVNNGDNEHGNDDMFVSAGRLACMAASYLCITSNNVYSTDNDEILELVALLPSLHEMPTLSYLVKGFKREVSTKAEFLAEVEVVTTQLESGVSPVPMIAKVMESLVDSFVIPPVSVNAGPIPVLASIGKSGTLNNILHQWKSKGISGQPLLLDPPPAKKKTDSTWMLLQRTKREIKEKQNELDLRKTSSYQTKLKKSFDKGEREKKEREKAERKERWEQQKKIRKEKKEKEEQERKEKRERERQELKELLSEKRKKEELNPMAGATLEMPRAFTRKPPPDVYQSIDTSGYYDGSNDNKLERGFYSKQAIFHALPPMSSIGTTVDERDNTLTDGMDTTTITTTHTTTIGRTVQANTRSDVQRILQERDSLVIKPLRGWNKNEFGVHKDDVSSLDWIDPRFCSFCRLGEDDMIDTANLYGERVALHPVSDEKDRYRAQETEVPPVDITSSGVANEVVLCSTSNHTNVGMNDDSNMEIVEPIDITSENHETAAPYGPLLPTMNSHEHYTSSSIITTYDLPSVDVSSSSSSTALPEDSSSVVIDETNFTSTLHKKPSESDFFDVEVGSKRKSVRPKDHREFVSLENTQTWKRAKTKEGLEEIRKEKQRLEYEMMKNDMYDEVKMRRSEDIYGRLIPLPDGTYSHINCTRWCRNIVERHGVLNNAIPLKENVYAGRCCTVCGQRRAVLTCANKSCMKFFHYGCALSVGCVFAETKLSSEGINTSHDIYTFMFCPIHKGDIQSKPVDVLSDMATTIPVSNPLRAITTLDQTEFENSDGDIIAMVSRRLVRSSFGLSFITATDDRAFRHGGLSSGGNAFKGTSRMLLTLGKNYIKENVLTHAASALASEKPFAFSSALRAGTITVLELGIPRVGPGSGNFHTDQLIFPYGYRSARIFWSYMHPAARTVYFFDILSLEDYHSQGIAGFDIDDMNPTDFEHEEIQSPSTSSMSETSATPSEHITAEKPVFRVVVVDDPSRPIFTRSIDKALDIILKRLEKGLHDLSHSNEAGYFAHARKCRKYQNDAYALTPSIFFGLGLAWVRRAIEMLPESVACMITPPPYAQYRPCYVLPTKTDILRVQDFESFLMRSKRSSINGCARADGWEVERKEVGTKVTRILAKTVGDEDDENKQAAGKLTRPSDDDRLINDDWYQEDLIESERVIEQTRQKYKEMAASYLLDEHNLEVRRSKIHGWGLFARTSFNRGDLIVEYIGQKIRQAVADKRETVYEDEGVGSCYLFRLDKDDIVDATRTGGMARFMNHCCDPNAYAGIINIPDGTNPFPVDKACAKIGVPVPESFHGKHIVIFAGRDIQEGEEITYDYKFPIEEKKLRCFCGSSKCQGSMN